MPSRKTVIREMGRLKTDRSLVDAIIDSCFEELPVLLRHADALLGLPRHHRDPFDRILIAQAQVERLTIVTRDQAFQAYDVSLVRC